MKTLIIILIIAGIVLAGIFAVNYFLNSKTEQPKLYQGPVPEGYDEDYFRHTGITKPLESN